MKGFKKGFIEFYKKIWYYDIGEYCGFMTAAILFMVILYAFCIGIIKLMQHLL